MKTAISIPDPLFQSAEALASRMGLSRDELFVRAMENFIQFHDPSDLKARLNAVYAVENAEVPPDLMAAQLDVWKAENNAADLPSQASPFSTTERAKRLECFRASRGKYRGILSSVDEFIAHKQEEKELER